MKLTAGLSHLVLIVKVDRFLTRIHKCWYSLEFGFHSLHSLRKRKSHTSSHTFNFHVQHIPPMYHHTLVFSIITHFPLNDGQTSTVQPSTCQSTTNRKYTKSKSKCKFTQIQTHRIDFNARFNPHLSLALTIPHRNAIIIEIFELGFSYVYKSILKFYILVHNAWWIDSDTGLSGIEIKSRSAISYGYLLVE